MIVTIFPLHEIGMLQMQQHTAVLILGKHVVFVV